MDKRFTMFAFAVVFLAIVSVSKATFIKKEHSLHPPFNETFSSLMFWDLTGSAEVADTYIRLTPDEEDKNGAVWNTFACLTNNWEFQVQFRIHGKGVHLNGDGMALWYVQESDKLHSGPVFGSKDFFSGLGVFIDTFANQDEPQHKHHHPYISAMINNGSLHYEHDEDGTMTQIGGCHVPVRNLEMPTKIAVSYINNELATYVDNEGIGVWRLCFKSAGVHLPTGNHFGISASTSDHSDNHDILSATVLNMDPDGMIWVDKGQVIPYVENIVIPEKYHKEFIEKEMQKRETEEDDEPEDDDEDIKEEPETKKTEADENPPTSLMRKLVYITGATAIILVSISTFKKYRERRRVRIEKRLY